MGRKRGDSKASTTRRNAVERTKNQIERSGLDANEVSIAVERYKQYKAQLEEAKAHPKSVTITILPGTNPDTSRAEQLELVRRARELELTSGKYEDWELVQFGDFVVSLRDDQHLDYYQQLMRYLDVGTKLIRHLDKIAVSVRLQVGNLWVESKTESGTKRVFPFSEVDSGLAGDYWIQLVTLAKGLSIDPMTIPPVAPFVTGIGKLINEEDRGQALREAVDNYEPSAFDNLQPYIDILPRTGAPPASVIDRLCIRAKSYIPAMTYSEAYDQMVKDLDRDGLKRLEQEEAKKLATWSVEAFEKAYRARMGKQVLSVN